MQPVFCGKLAYGRPHAQISQRPAGVKVTVFAKSAAWNSDLYEELVAPALKSGLVAQTWQNGGGNDWPYCTGDKAGHKYDVVDATSQSRGGIEWQIHQDHSKWAIGSVSAPGVSPATPP